MYRFYLCHSIESFLRKQELMHSRYLSQWSESSMLYHSFFSQYSQVEEVRHQRFITDVKETHANFGGGKFWWRQILVDLKFSWQRMRWVFVIVTVR